MSAAPDAMKGAFANVRRVFAPIAKDVKQIADGASPAPGITAVAAPGHTPGHTAYRIASGNASLLFIADLTNHPALFVKNPDWSAVFDMDADAARAHAPQGAGYGRGGSHAARLLSRALPGHGLCRQGRQRLRLHPGAVVAGGVEDNRPREMRGAPAAGAPFLFAATTARLAPKVRPEPGHATPPDAALATLFPHRLCRQRNARCGSRAREPWSRAMATLPPDKADVVVALGGDGLMLQTLHRLKGSASRSMA